MKIAVWGDSITRGASDFEQGGWVNRLNKYLANKSNSSIAVYNLGISGEKVGQVLSRFPHEYNDLNPDLIVLAIGINDSPHKNYKKGTPLDIFEKKYFELIEEMKAPKKPLIIVGLTNVDDEHPKVVGYSNKSIEQYTNIIKRLAQKNKLLYVDLWKIVLKQDLQIDGLHPDSNGHEKIFKLVSKAVQLSI
jgi:lysophospholipase L1-like esterase